MDDNGVARRNISEFPMSRRPRVCALVVTFNRKELLAACIRSLVNQTYPLEGICIVDNASTDGTRAYLGKAGLLPSSVGCRSGQHAYEECWLAGDVQSVRLRYLREGTNKGGSGGFWRAMRFAQRFEYDGYWLMDDDAMPAPAALSEMVRYWDRPGLVGLACAVTTASKLALFHRGYFDFRFNDVYPVAHRVVPPLAYLDGPSYIDMASFVGLLVKSSAVKLTGLPRRRFFIQHDDTDYCIRLRRFGNILLVPSALIDHREAQHARADPARLLWLTSQRTAPERLSSVYYSLRNLAWIGREYHTSFAHFVVTSLIAWLRACFSIVLFDRRQRILRLRLVTSAYWDGVRGRFDNAKPHRILRSTVPPPVSRNL